jgi:DNA polymerase
MGPAEQLLRNLAAAGGHRYVGSRGDLRSPCCIIGEAPGADEEREGQPFVGSSGRLLTSLCREEGLQQRDYWVTNIYKVRPPDNDLSRLAELGIPEDAFDSQLLEELYATKPTIIIAAGATPLAHLCPFTVSRKTGTGEITKWRGSLLSSPRLQWPHYIIPVTHPAAILREWSERPIAGLCIGKAKEEVDYFRQSGKLRPLPNRRLLTQLSASDARDFVRCCIEQEQPVSLDIELRGKRVDNKTRYINPDMIALARSPWEAASILLFDDDLTTTAKLWRLLDELLLKQRIIGQNHIGFDAQWLYRLGFEPPIEGWLDTMVLHHFLWIELPHSLQFLGMQYLREPYWKDEGRLWSPGDGIGQKMLYNAKDAACTYEVCIKELEELAERSHRRFNPCDIRWGWQC